MKIESLAIVIFIIIGIAVIVTGSGAFVNIALSKSTLHHTKKPSSLNPGPMPYFGSNQSSTHLYFAPPPPASSRTNLTNAAINSTNKAVMINFDDGWKSQLLYAKPILDEYVYKATFFIPCAKMGTTPYWMTWQDIAGLRNDRMDIESHTMTHAHLTTLLSSPTKLTYEIGFSRQCLANHGYNTPIFAYPLNLGSDNPTIVNLVAKYYDLARSGSSPLMFLDCNGPTSHQSDCSTYSTNGKLNYVNRYDIRSQSFFHISNGQNFSPAEMFQKFVQRMNSQIPYNTNGKINVIPIITYHNLTNNMKDYDSAASTITVSLFAEEMKYLHDNGFRVLLLNQFGFNPTNNVFYLKNVPSYNGTTTNAATLLSGAPSYSISNSK
jgi:hypothetical protein